MQIIVRITTDDLLRLGACRRCNITKTFIAAHPDGVWHVDNWTLKESLYVAKEWPKFARGLIAEGLIPPVTAYGANLYQYDLCEAVLSGATLDSVTLVGANLERADLTLANLFRADLKRANLHRVQLDGADLRFANLDDAVLTKALLGGTNLSGAYMKTAKLDHAYLRYARYDKNTVFPDGFDPAARGMVPNWG